MIRDMARYHKLKWNGGQITLSKDLGKKLPWENTEKLYVEYDPNKQSLTITKA